MGGLATSPLPSGGSPMLQSGGQNQHRPTSGWIGYITPTVWGSGQIGDITPAVWAGPQRFRVGDEISSGPQMGRLGTCMHSFVKLCNFFFCR